MVKAINMAAKGMELDRCGKSSCKFNKRPTAFSVHKVYKCRD
jgi:hypothetical protein